MREAVPPDPSPGPLLQPRVPRGGTAMAAAASQPPVPTDGSRAGEAPGPVPAVPVSMRRASACGRSQLHQGRGPGRRRACRDRVRGSARSQRFPVFSLRSPWLRRALRAHPTESLSAVLQLLLPSGIATSDRARAAVGPARAGRAPAESETPVPRPLRLVVPYRRRVQGRVRIDCPGRRKGREGSGITPAPRSLSPIPSQMETRR